MSLLTKKVLKDNVITRADQGGSYRFRLSIFDAGMDWLSAYHARVDCFRKIVTQHLVNHRLNLLGGVMNIPLQSRLFMPLHFCLHGVHGFHFGEQSVLGLKDIPQALLHARLVMGFTKY
jgi:hypothetical protein